MQKLHTRKRIFLKVWPLRLALIASCILTPYQIALASDTADTFRGIFLGRIVSLDAERDTLSVLFIKPKERRVVFQIDRRTRLKGENPSDSSEPATILQSGLYLAGLYIRRGQLAVLLSGHTTANYANAEKLLDSYRKRLRPKKKAPPPSASKPAAKH